MRVKILPLNDEDPVIFGETISQAINGIISVQLDRDAGEGTVIDFPEERVKKAGWDEGVEGEEEGFII